MATTYRRKILNQIINTGKKLTLPFGKSREASYLSQIRTLKKLLEKASQTEYGKKYKFLEILNSKFIYKNFQKNVPVVAYEEMMPFWNRAYNGEENITWPGKIEHFALSSGTSEGSSKFIPVSRDMIKSITKASGRQVLSVARTEIPKDYLAKQYLMLGGSTNLVFNKEGKTYAGDLSGITTSNVPNWFDKFSKPSHDIRAVKNWEEKIDLIVKEAPNWDIVGIAGVPAWIQILFETIIKRYNLKSIHDLWPHLSFYLWGGVAIEPYQKSLSQFLGKPLMYFETYLASEGFVAFQTKSDAKGMRLNFKNGMFFEFVPFNEKNFDEEGKMIKNPEVLSLRQVEENKEYAILLTTCSGAFRYLIGDTIKFVDLEKCEIKITGRTKHFLSLCGEHVSVENMNQTMKMLSDELNLPINEYTVKGLTIEGKHQHHWFISLENSGLKEIEISKKIDEYMSSVNDDYKVERKHALSKVVVNIIKPELFINWMAEQGKKGSQHKFPRVLTNQKFEEWVNFLKRNNVKLSAEYKL